MRWIGVWTLFAACGDEPKVPEPVQPSLVVVTIDTVRADYVGIHSAHPDLTPTINALAAEGVSFERAYSVVPLTTAAHASMFTGLYPPKHGVRTNGDAVVPEEANTLAEVLQGRGYRTAASVSAFVTTRIWNLDQGFDTYLDSVEGARVNRRWSRERTAGPTVDDAVAWLGTLNKDEPFFLWVHLYDAHHPHAAPEAFAAQHPEDPYAAEIAYVDSEIGRLRQAVPEENVAWIVVADHGEALHREHGEASHGWFLFEPTMRIPMVVRPASPLAAPVVVDESAVSNVDVLPTALGLLGIEVPAGLDGVDLSAWTETPGKTRGPVYFESVTLQQRFGFHPEVGAAEGPWKLMATPDSRLYQVNLDPRELVNELTNQPERAQALRTFVEGVRTAPAMNGAVHADPEVIAQLEALGYVGAGEALPSETSTVDAKTQLALVERVSALNERIPCKDEVAACERELKEVLKDAPTVAEAWSALGSLYNQNGRESEAVDAYRQALLLRPQSATVRSNLVYALLGAHREQEALAEAEAVLAALPRDTYARQAMIHVLGAQHRPEQAVVLLEGWLAESPDSPMLQAMLGKLLIDTDRPKALRLLKASLSDGVPRDSVSKHLGQAAFVEGNLAEASRLFRAELRISPNDREARRLLGETFMAMKDWDEAAAEYAWIVENYPDDVSARLGQAQAVFNAGDYSLSASILAPALLSAPEDPYVLLLHANLLNAQGEKDEAKIVFERAKALKAKRSKR